MAQTKPSGDDRSSKNDAVLGFVILVGVLIGLGFLVKGLCPTDLPAGTTSNFIDNIFHNRGVVLAARLLLVSAAVVLAVGGVFIVVSTAIRMKNGEWLRKAGPFEVSETALSDIETQLEKWQRASEVGQEEVAELTERIKDSDELIEQLQNELQDGQRSQ
jgi:hypothetical protein